MWLSNTAACIPLTFEISTEGKFTFNTWRGGSLIDKALSRTFLPNFLATSKSDSNFPCRWLKAIALIPTILGGPGSVNAGLIATQAIIALDFPLAMAVSAIMMFTLMGLLYLGHRLFNLTKLLEPIS